jgi:hypothetical protein
MPVKVTINRNWSSNILADLEIGQLEMMTDIHKRSNILAPVDTAAMVNSSMIKRLARFVMAITYGSGRVPYARKQFFEHKTKSHYLTKAADSVIRGNIAKYFRGKI